MFFDRDWVYSRVHRRFNSSSRPSLSSQRGMTLIEIMIVLVLVGGLIAVLSGNVFSNLFKGQRKQAEIQIKEVSKALDLFYTDCSFYPSTEQGLRALVENNSDCKSWGPDPYLKKEPVDPWNNSLVYESDGSTYVIKSYGKDRREGGSGNDADISSEEI